MAPALYPQHELSARPPEWVKKITLSGGPQVLANTSILACFEASFGRP
jgi:hypothetical protein